MKKEQDMSTINDTASKDFYQRSNSLEIKKSKIIVFHKREEITSSNLLMQDL